MQPSMVDETVSYVNASLGLDIGANSSLPETNPNSSHTPVMSKFVESHKPRRASIASGHIAKATAAVAALQEQQKLRHNSHRSESEHTRLVEGACRHIAEAAAQAAVAAVKDNDVQVEEESRRKVIKIQRKRRRGGILGFKELAAKSGLSPWHFHRVFRSITGLTPKAYGDACWKAVTAKLSDPELLTNIKEEHGIVSQNSSDTIDSVKESLSTSVTPKHTPNTKSQSLPTPTYYEPVTPYENTSSMGCHVPQFDSALSSFDMATYDVPFESCSSMTSPESTISFEVPFMSPVDTNFTLAAPAPESTTLDNQHYFYDWYQPSVDLPQMPVSTPSAQPSFMFDVPDNMSDSTATQPFSCSSTSSASSLLDSDHPPGDQFRDEMAFWIDGKDSFAVDQNPSFVDMAFQ